MAMEAGGRELRVDVSSSLGSVGDRTQVRGVSGVEFQDGFSLEFVPGEAIEWSLMLRRIAGGAEIAGRVSGDIRLECYRCLEEYDYPLDAPVREHALWLESSELEPADEPADEYVVIDGMLDLEPLLRDVITLSVPVKRLCFEACAGLCQGCGVNLNREDCDCPDKPFDARLKPLADLKKKLEARGEGPQSP